MANVQLANEAIEAFNRVLHLSGDELEALQRAEWTLRKLFVRNRSDIVAALGLLHACEMLGRRDEAVSLSDELWGRRNAFEPEDRLTCSMLAASIGEYHRAADLADVPDALLSVPLRAQRAAFIARAIEETWDPKLFERFGRPQTSAFAAFEEDASRIGLLDVLGQRQALINSILADVQCGSNISIGTDGDTGTVMTRMVYVSGDRPTRDALTTKLLDAEESFYIQHSICVSDARWLVGEVILPVEARGPALDSIARASR